MPTDANLNDAALPPVTPPSGRFIAQLFLVPGLIVTVAVLILLGVHMMFGDAQTPTHFLSKLDSNNDDVRWRGASDLAQVLERKESVELRSNAKFALDLCERLRTALGELKVAEKMLAEQLKDANDEARQKLWRRIDPKRNTVIFLTSALADFNVPVGVPLLCELAERDDSPDKQGNAHLRRMAVFALGNLGENTKGFNSLPAERQQSIIRDLQNEVGGSKERATWAKTGLHYLKKAGPEGAVLVDESLAKCARADDWELRGHVAFALRFWDGPLVEPTLLMLARDDGHGTLVQPTMDE